MGRDGVTLLELIVVLALVGVAAGLTLPPLGAGLRQWRLQGAVREVRTLLTFARNEAVAQRVPLQVVVDRARGFYWLDAADPAVLEDPLRDEHPKIRRYTLPSGVRFGEVKLAGGMVAGDRIGIPFFPRGTSAGGELQIVDARQRSYRISIHPFTGQARIEG